MPLSIDVYQSFSFRKFLPDISNAHASLKASALRSKQQFGCLLLSKR